jgi:hypothetical protein
MNYHLHHCPLFPPSPPRLFYPSDKSLCPFIFPSNTPSPSPLPNVSQFAIPSQHVSLPPRHILLCLSIYLVRILLLPLPLRHHSCILHPSSIFLSERCISNATYIQHLPCHPSPCLSHSYLVRIAFFQFPTPPPSQIPPTHPHLLCSPPLPHFIISPFTL